MSRGGKLQRSASEAAAARCTVTAARKERVSLPRLACLLRPLPGDHGYESPYAGNVSTRAGALAVVLGLPGSPTGPVSPGRMEDG